MANYSIEQLKKEAFKGGDKFKQTAAKMLIKERMENRPQPKPTTNMPKANVEKKVKEKSIRANSVAFRNGNNSKVKTVIVLSAPGQVEEKAGRPAAGQTGKTLQTAITKLHNTNPSDFPSDHLDDYTIMNAVEDVHYKAKTGRTEGSKDEIIQSSNMERVNSILSEATNVVALGDKAQLAVDKSSYQGSTFKAKHPSMQALNKKYKSDKKTSYERSQDRIEQWTKELEKS